jgi:hypothetical protein
MNINKFLNTLKLLTSFPMDNEQRMQQEFAGTARHLRRMDLLFRAQDQMARDEEKRKGCKS